jgi:hypothetical protein
VIAQRDQIIKQLAEFCAKYPTRNKAAKALKVTPAQLSQTLNKKNNVIPERILKRLGYRSELVYSSIAPKKPNKRAAAKKVAKKTPTRRVAKSEALGAEYKKGTAALPSNGQDAYQMAAALITPVKPKKQEEQHTIINIHE